MSLRRDEGCIYLCFLLRPVGFCFSKILHLCHLGVTKSACPTAAEKCLSTAICPYSRWRSQPLSRVSRKQRYKHTRLCKQNRVPTGMLAPLLETLRQRGFPPLNTPYFLRCEYPSCKNTVWNTCSENAKEAVLSHNTCVVELLSFIELQHQTGSAKPVQYLHSCRLIVAQFLEGKLPDLG